MPSVIDELNDVFAAESLPAPPVPGPLAARLQQLDPGIFGTHLPAASLYDLEAQLEAAAEQPEDALLLGFDGHGVNSWAVHYQLATGPLLLLVQRPWGGAYMNAERNRADIERTFAAVAALQQAAADAADRLPAGRRVAVVVGAVGPSRWAWLEGASLDGAAWRDGGAADVLAAAADALREAAGTPM
jgi:hypothetical protein